MPAKPPLRAVAPDETAERKAPRSILAAAEAGSRLEELRAMRRRLARAMDDVNTPARDLAALSRRQLEIGKEIDAILVETDDEHSVVAQTDDESFDGTGY